MSVYGYYRTGALCKGKKSIVFMHLVDESGVRPLCGNERELTLSEFTLGKPICRGCASVDKRKKRKKQKEERRLHAIERSASMF
jgi:hypothetical protein